MVGSSLNAHGCTYESGVSSMIELRRLRGERPTQPHYGHFCTISDAVPGVLPRPPETACSSNQAAGKLPSFVYALPGPVFPGRPLRGRGERRARRRTFVYEPDPRWIHQYLKRRNAHDPPAPGRFSLRTRSRSSIDHRRHFPESQGTRHDGGPCPPSLLSPCEFFSATNTKSSAEARDGWIGSTSGKAAAQLLAAISRPLWPRQSCAPVVAGGSVPPFSPSASSTGSSSVAVAAPSPAAAAYPACPLPPSDRLIDRSRLSNLGGAIFMQ